MSKFKAYDVKGKKHDKNSKSKSYSKSNSY